MNPMLTHTLRAALVAALLATTMQALAAPPEALPMDVKAGEALPVPPREQIRLRTIPDVEPLRQAFWEAQLGSVRVRFDVSFDDLGRITRATPLDTTGDRALDELTAEWVKRATVETRVGGRGILPFVFDEGDGDSALVDALPPPPESVTAAARDAGLPVIRGELTLRHQRDGRWLPALRRGSGDEAVDAAVLAWASTLPPPRLAAGFVSYPLDIVVPPAP
jgi:hypothetical protein